MICKTVHTRYGCRAKHSSIIPECGRLGKGSSASRSSWLQCHSHRTEFISSAILLWSFTYRNSK